MATRGPKVRRWVARAQGIEAEEQVHRPGQGSLIHKFGLEKEEDKQGQKNELETRRSVSQVRRLFRDRLIIHWINQRGSFYDSSQAPAWRRKFFAKRHSQAGAWEWVILLKIYSIYYNSQSIKPV